jgi:hypothetical protein
MSLKPHKKATKIKEFTSEKKARQIKRACDSTTPCRKQMQTPVLSSLPLFGGLMTTRDLHKGENKIICKPNIYKI